MAIRAHPGQSSRPADFLLRGCTKQGAGGTGPVGSEPRGVIEEERKATHTVLETPEEENETLRRFSMLFRLIRVTAFCCRFLNSRKERGTEIRRRPPVAPFLSTGELGACRQRLLRVVQQHHIAGELEALFCERPLPRSSSIATLRPMLDRDGLLRVGGRLEHSALPYEGRHSIILSKRSHLTKLIIREAHQQTLHGGQKLTRGVLSEVYWIIHANSIIKAELRQCVKCIRQRGEAARQQMGQLPAARVQPQRPFLTTGVDFAGPLRLRAAKGRGHAAYKGYICLLVCTATKAVHLEAVSDLSTAAFLAAFKRFVLRRGRCATLLSDNGNNFKGADKELRSMFRRASEFYKDCGARLAEDGTEWQFIPPAASHFGGLWEAGVRSVKFHLRRVIGEHALTYEELSTLLCEIEACLNSRPITAMSEDPEDFSVLTPGHFLVGEALVAVPQPSLANTPAEKLRVRWELVSHMHDQVWKRWQQEYLHTLQPLAKWLKQEDNVVPGTHQG